MLKRFALFAGCLVWAGFAAVAAEPMLSYRPGKTGVYDVWLKWTFADGKQDARIEVAHMGGVTGVAVNQQNMPGWHFIGTFALAKDSEILATNRSVDTKNAVADPPRGFEEVKLVPTVPRTVELEAHDGLSVCELNVGDTARFKMTDGRVRTVTLVGASSEILARRADNIRVSRYSFTQKLVVDGVERTLVTVVPSTAFINAVPFEFDGLQIFPDGVTDTYWDAGGFLRENTWRWLAITCRPLRRARLVLREASRRLVPERTCPCFEGADRAIADGQCYDGHNCWAGPNCDDYRFIGEAHGGFDFNMSPRTPVFAPFAFDDQFYLSRLTRGDSNNRWRGIRRWSADESWWFQCHHIDEPVTAEGTPLAAGARFALSGGLWTGAFDHSHFCLRVLHRVGAMDGLPAWESSWINPALLFRQMREDKKPSAVVEGRRCEPDGRPVEWVFDAPAGLVDAAGVEFDFFAERPEDFDQFRVAFKSGKGAYVAAFDPGEAGRWTHVTLKKSDAWKNDGQVAGWGAVEKFAVYGVRTANSKRTIRLADIRAFRTSPEIVVVRGDTANNRQGHNHYDYTTCAMTKLLERIDAPVVQMSDLDLARGIPAGVKLLAFPANPSIDTNALPVLKAYAARGGKFLVSGGTDSHVRHIAGVVSKHFYDRRTDKGKRPLATIRRLGAGLPGQPEQVKDTSYCILEPELRKGEVEPLATWFDADGNDSGIVALAKIPRGFCHAAVWPKGGADARNLLKSVLVAIEPAWRKRLEAGERAAWAADILEGEWLKTLPTAPGEERMIDCHDPKGVFGHTWDEAVRRVKEGGFNAMEPNVAWAGAFARDDAAECLAACRKHGVKCCFWKVCWRVFANKGAKVSGRFQKAFDGRTIDGWLCPADPANRAAELQLFLDMASLKPDAVAFDYIRYDSGFHCACDGCRAEMERRLGRPIKNWRADVWEKPDAKEKWLAYRRQTLTTFVREVSERVRAQYPGVKLRADVIPNPDTARDWFAQDWGNWAREGILDVVCPMIYYTGNAAGFKYQLRYQVERLKGAKAVICPTLGLAEWPKFGIDARRMAEEILALRELGCPGFGVFQLGERAFDVFPALRSGVTAEFAGALSGEADAVGKAVVRTVTEKAALPQSVLSTVNDRLSHEFIGADGLLLDYVGDIPTPDEIADLKPNAMGWWSPIENGSMFTGEWLPALMAEGPSRRATVERCVRGLIKMSEVSDVPGFIARGTGTDGKSHHPCGSNDQTDPWFLGLCEYCRWPHSDVALKAKAIERLTLVAKALEANGWGVPCDGPFKGQNRGNLKAREMPFWGKTRLLYSLKSLHQLTGDAHWGQVYDEIKATALKEIAAGGEVDAKRFEACFGSGVWIYVSSAQMLARLIEMETAPADRAQLQKGLQHFAERVAPLMKNRAMYENTTERPFKYANWRKGYAWRVQKTQREAEAVAYSGKKDVLGTRKNYERNGMANPLAAAAVCALQGDVKFRKEILATLRHYDYSTPNISEFFHAAIAAAALRSAKLPPVHTLAVDADEKR